MARSASPGCRQVVKRSSRSLGKPLRSTDNKDAPARLHVLVDVIDLQGHDISSVSGAELGARPGAEEHSAVPATDVVDRYDVQRPGALDMGVATDATRRKQSQALLAAQPTQLTRLAETVLARLERLAVSVRSDEVNQSLTRVGHGPRQDAREHAARVVSFRSGGQGRKTYGRDRVVAARAGSRER